MIMPRSSALRTYTGNNTRTQTHTYTRRVHTCTNMCRHSQIHTTTHRSTNDLPQGRTYLKDARWMELCLELARWWDTGSSWSRRLLAALRRPDPPPPTPDLTLRKLMAALARP